jgi:hypothetical protein
MGAGYVGVDYSDGVTVLEFTTTEDGVLKVLNGATAGTNGGTNPNASGSDSYVLFGGGLTDLTCSATINDDGTCPLTCQGTRGTTNFDCGVYWRVGSEADSAGCSVFSPYAVGEAVSQP